MKHSAAISAGLAPILLAAVLIAGSGLGHAQSSQDNDDCHGRGNASLDQVIGGCTAMIQNGHLSGQDLANAYYNRGLAHSMKREFDPAIADLSQTVKLNPGDAEALDERGADYFGKSQFDLALADFSQSIRLDPKAFKAYYNRGTVYNAKSQWALAVADFTQAINLNSGIGAIYYNRAIAEDKLGRHDQAQADYAKAVQLDPHLNTPPQK